MNHAAHRRPGGFMLFVALCVGAIASASADTPERQDGNTPGTFLNVTPSDNLTAGQTVTVVGTGFAPNNTSGQIYQCTDASCRQPRLGTFTTDGSGGFTATVSVVTTYTNSDGVFIDCRAATCYMYAFTGGPTSNAQHHLSFAGGPTSSTTPTSTSSTLLPTTSTTVLPTTSTSTSTTTLPTTSTSTSSTSTTIGGNACEAGLAATRAQLNTRVDRARAQILATVPAGSRQATLLAQLEASRAQANAQLDRAIAACP